jgi:hypothetical protein
LTALVPLWAIVFGGLLVCMLAGFLGGSSWPFIDLAGKVVLNVLAILLMLGLAWRVRRNAASLRAQH